MSRYVYSVVRFVPSPTRGEFVNIAVIAGAGQGWGTRLVEDLSRARAIDHEGVLPHVLEHFKLVVDAPIEQKEASEEWLTQLSRDMNNIMQVTPPAPMLAGSVEVALNLAYPHFILNAPALLSSIDLDAAAQSLVKAFYLYPHYRVDSRGPAGCLIDALKVIAPHIAAEFANGDEADAIFRRHWPSEE